MKKANSGLTAIAEVKNLNSALAECCFRARKYKNLTQAELAEKINRSTRTVINIEKGRGTHLDTMQDVCRVLDINPSEIIQPERINLPDYIIELNDIVNGCSREEAALVKPVILALLNQMRSGH